MRNTKVNTANYESSRVPTNPVSVYKELVLSVEVISWCWYNQTALSVIKG